MSIGLAENGYATLYTGGGAEYNGNRERLEKSIDMAKRKKRGVWENGASNVMSPADYKRAVKAKKAATSR